MNLVFFAIVGIAFVVAGWRQLQLPPGAVEAPMEALGSGAVKAAEAAVTLGIGLIGAMALFLGLLKVAEAAGLMRALARLLRPLLQRMFPEVPPAHPAMGAMVMNVAANMLGLSNAATPFGVRAMQRLEGLNPVKGTATDAMVLFLALNTANVTLLPTHVMALRTALGSHDPAAVIPTTLFATLGSTGFAVAVAKWGRRWFPVDGQGGEGPGGEGPGREGQVGATGPSPASPERGQDARATDATPPPYPRWVSWLAVAAAASLLPITLAWGRSLSPWIIPALLVGVLGGGLAKGVPIYERFVQGAKEGLAISIRILPYLVAILVAVGMFKDSGAMELLIGPLGRLTAPLGLPPEALTMAVLRTLSGSASFGYLASLLKDPAIGPDSYLGVLLSTIYGSSETTFYVLAVYFGAAGVRRIRHALIAGLLADAGGLVFSVAICRWLYG